MSQDLKSFFKNNLCWVLIPAFFLFCFYRAYEGTLPTLATFYSIDLEYPYLFNALNMAKFGAVAGYEHPGTTVQILGFLILTAYRFLFLKGSTDSLIKAVLTNPQHFINIYASVISLIYGFTLYYVGKGVYEITHSKIAGLLIQITPFLLSAATTMYGIYLGPETSLLIVNYWLGFVLLKRAFTPEHFSEKKTAVLVGIVGAAGLATKFPYLPVLIVPLFMFSKFRYFVYYGMSFLVSFLVIIRPIWNRFPEITAWIKQLLTHTGNYGGGNKGFIDPHRALNSIPSLLQAQPVFFETLFMGGAILFYFYFFHKANEQDKSSRKLILRLVVGLLLGMSAQLLLVLKHPEAHYLNASVSLVFAVLVLISTLILGKTGKTVSPAVKVLTALAISAVLLINATQTLRFFFNLDSHYRQDVLADIQNLDNTIDQKYKNCALVTYRPYTVDYGLMFGDHSLHMAYVQNLSNLYPNHYYYDIYLGNLKTWNSDIWTAPITFSDLKSKYPCIVLRGQSQEKTKKFDMAIPVSESLREAVKGTYANIYEVQY